MTREEIEKILDEIGLPYRYDHFTQKEMKEIPLPIIVWIIPGTDNFFADGKTYHKIKELNIEVYTDDESWDIEEKVETILDNHEIGWECTGPEWLETESMWMRLYEMEV